MAPLKKICALILLLLFAGLITGCGAESPTFYEIQKQEIIMDTYVDIQVFSEDKAQGEKALEVAFAEFERINTLSDRFAEKNLSDPQQSDVYRINLAAGIRPVKVSPDTLAMVEQSMELSPRAEDVFDITIGPVADLWGFGKESQKVPDEQELRQTLALVNYRDIIIDEGKSTVFLPKKGMEMDLGGVAKGYATDKAVEKLREMGIKHALVDAGGNIYALGTKPDGSPWRIGIRDPRKEDGVVGILSLQDEAAVTSGDYERFFVQDGIRYHHILNPHTGKPARASIETTIVAKSAAEADILSTATFILGPQKGLGLVNQLDGIRAVIIAPDHTIHYSDALQQQIEFTGEGGYTVSSR